MTEEDVKNWKIERDIARKSGKPELLQIAYDHRDDLMMHCIQRQADRVKTLVKNDERTEVEIAAIKKDVGVIKGTVGDHESVVQQIRKGRERFFGAWLLLKVLALIAALGGSGIIGWLLALVNAATTGNVQQPPVGP